jgi:hypothetical protein
MILSVGAGLGKPREDSNSSDGLSNSMGIVPTTLKKKELMMFSDFILAGLSQMVQIKGTYEEYCAKLEFVHILALLLLEHQSMYMNLDLL